MTKASNAFTMPRASLIKFVQAKAEQRRKEIERTEETHAKMIAEYPHLLIEAFSNALDDLRRNNFDLDEFNFTLPKKPESLDRDYNLKRQREQLAVIEVDLEVLNLITDEELVITPSGRFAKYL